MEVVKMKLKKCKHCNQVIRNHKGMRKKEVIAELCDLMGWDKDEFLWKIQNQSMKYELLKELVDKLTNNNQGFIHK